MPLNGIPEVVGSLSFLSANEFKWLKGSLPSPFVVEYTKGYTSDSGCGRIVVGMRSGWSAP